MRNRARTIQSVLLSALFLLSPAAFADTGLVIHGVEIGVAKFHREDNRVRPYSGDNAWNPTVLPANASLQTPQTIHNPDGSYSVFFSTLEELLRTARDLSSKAGAKIQVFNIHGHGLPGGMWYPKNKQELDGWLCADWRDSAAAPDTDNFHQYYSAVSKDEIMQIRSISNNPNVHYPCVSDLKAWQEQAQGMQAYFSPSAQIHFLSCVVGLGSVGQSFTEGVAKLLIPAGAVDARVETSMDFGLGDGTMPEGMGFWDYQNDSQLNHDNGVYPVDHSDREIMQKGQIRAAHASGSGVISDRDFMYLDSRSAPLSSIVATPVEAPDFTRVPRVRIPGTAKSVPVLSN